MTFKIGLSTFSGTAKVFDGTLARVVIAMAQGYARNAVIAAAPTALTDSSTGTAGGHLSNYTALVKHVLSGTDSTPKAGLETALATVIAAISELGAQTNLLANLVGVEADLQLPTGQTTDKTINAVTKTVAGAGTALAPYAGTNAKLKQIYFFLAAVVQEVNAVCHAVGIAPTDTLKGVKTTVDFTGLTAGVGTAVSGAAGQEGVLATAVNAELLKLANSIAVVAAKLNAVTSATRLPPAVVAVG